MLTAVDYPGVRLAADDVALAAARQAFDERHWAARTDARAAAQVLAGFDDG